MQCDAIKKKGKRCTRKRMATIPCGGTIDTGDGVRKPVEFRDVHLCGQHWNKSDELKRNGKRLKLHHGGWLGAYNSYKYGNLVIDRPDVNWETVKCLHVPKYWGKKDDNATR